MLSPHGQFRLGIVGSVGKASLLALVLLGATIVSPAAWAQKHGSTGSGAGASGPVQVPATDSDFHQKGTQPLGAGLPGSFAPLNEPASCISCHANYGNQDPMLMAEPYAPWVASMMGQSGRDPLFYAGMTIANQDVSGAGQYCIRCHLPQAFLEGHSTPADGSAITPADRAGVHCAFCHRLVDPVYKPNLSPVED